MSYLDTSVLVAYYCPEPLSPRVQKALARIDAPTISPLVEVEMYSAVAAKVRKREMGVTVARQIFAQLHKHMAESRFRVVPVQAAEYAQAREWINQLSSPVRALDALHLAAAHSHGLCLVTADRQLAWSARHFGVNCKFIV